MPYHFKAQEGFLKMSSALPPVHMSIILLDTHLQISILQSSPCLQITITLGSAQIILTDEWSGK